MVSWDGVDSVIGLGGGAVSNFLKIFIDEGLDRKIGVKKEDVDSFVDMLQKKAMDYKKSLGELMKKYNKPIIHVEIGKIDSAYQNMKDFRNLNVWEKAHK